ncbi:Type III restriction enzyme, res subunit [Acididesulfobacillus acetoxydans]|uniref:Replication restart protein PriA n=1 Tax=Acididesulfobacillus acetoxydans TaxID=1561005 RepID=A0A8S0VY91_9FIRM|nr:primosomal protein N' [Acididesulfobacillus acetoxydans]CAA7602763.1 Type III restriction enzyme, res subunit [Acididesulfobacillus acetoxydans]CEJ06380.1 Primosomal protein N' [Acididesulfobacillus acetoxydans]
MTRYAEVMPDVANRRLDRTYHYIVQDDMKAAAGMRVLIPLQGRQVQGLIVRVADRLPKEAEGKELRPVLKILAAAAVPAEMIELARWLAETTLCSVAQSLRTVWPLLKGKVEEWVIPLAGREDPDVETLRWLDPETYACLEVLGRSRRRGLPLKTFLQRARVGGDFLKQLIGQGWVKTETRFSSAWKTGARSARIPSGGVSREAPREADTREIDTREIDTREADTREADTRGVGTQEADTREADTREADTREADTREADAFRGGGVRQSACADSANFLEEGAYEALISQDGTPAEAFPNDCEKRECGSGGQAESSTEKLFRVSWGEKILSREQKAAVTEIISALGKGAARTLLLHGVTGSGKTEVYRRVIQYLLLRGGDVILLVPEISLTAQLARYFKTDFGSQMLVLHSGLKPGEKARAWEKILEGNVHLVIGARSAVFAPLPALKLIILDEEHDQAYKQDENPKYHARDVARKRMEYRQGVVLLGSATPSLEAYAAARSGKAELLTMRERIGSCILPPVEVVDMREDLAKGNRSLFSLSLQTKLRERLERGEQSMLFLNRRGYATFVVCRECGYVARCPDCDVALTYHTQDEVMRCHYCNHTEETPHRCPECGSRYIRFFGLGTQRVEEELRGLWPQVRVLRLDWDAVHEQGHEEILAAFRRQEAQVLVGTQMMAKGLDFPNVTLVGIVAADQTLQMPDFRARERTFQLLTQVAGRAGRSEKPGEVVIQTYTPADRAIQHASVHDFEGFFWEEIRYRKERRYPPFTHVIRVLVQGEEEERVIKGAHELATALFGRMPEHGNGNTELLNVLGPAPAVLPRLKKQFRWQVLVKGKNIEILRAFLHGGIEKFFQSSAAHGIILNIEVDPMATA